MDGTILDLAYDNWFWQTLVPERYAAARNMSVDEARASLRPNFEAVAHTLPWYCMDYWSEVTGLDMAALKHESRERIGVLAGAEDFLHAVKASGRKLWLATNAHGKSWRVKLDKTGIGHYFEHIISSHDHGHPKEAQSFWHEIQGRYPFDKTRALFVDDSLPVLRAAATYGIGHIRAIAAPDTQQPLREITEFASVHGLKDLLPLS